jgi:AraC family transcriptional regulator
MPCNPLLVILAGIFVVTIVQGLNKLAAMLEVPPRFRLFFWPHHILVLAPGFTSALHRHHAAQVVIALDGWLEYRGESLEWQRASGFVAPPDIRHAHRSTGPIVMLYLDAESSDWRASDCCRSAGGGLKGWSPGPDALDAAADAYRSGSVTAAADYCDRVLGEPSTKWSAPDPRIMAAQRFIAARLDRAIRITDISREIHLSPSRLAHVFQLATGIPVRRYVQWCRLRAAIEAALQGRSLTDAAHEAGFADAAHLSRTFRAMFGIAPSEVTQHAAVVMLPQPSG